MDHPGTDVERVVDDLEDVYGEVPVHAESTPVPREMYVECMNASDRGELGGVRVLVSHGDEFLLVRRTGDDTWDAPGGSLSRNDTHAVAATRHVVNQTGVECTIVDAFATVEREFTLVDGGDGVSGIWVFFEAEAFDPDLSLGADVEDAKWFSRPPDGIDPRLSNRFRVVAADD